MKQDRSLDSLETKTKKRVEAFLALCAKRKLSVLITETRRSKARQLYLYAFGRWGANKTKAAVTWTLNSNHIKGTAIDFVPLKDGRAYYNAPLSVWNLYLDLAEEVGLKSLYRTSGRDLPHLNYDDDFVQVNKKMISNEEKILTQRMNKAWETLKEANYTKKYLAQLKKVPYHPYIITTSDQSEEI